MPVTKFRPSFTFTQDRLAQLQTLVPEAFADGKINWESLKQALGEFLEDENPQAEHFGLFWPGKREAKRLATIPPCGTLVPVPGEGIDEDKTGNIFIEGENLEVLKLLLKSYAGRVKMIYIDPPYNTGNDDFLYNDDYIERLDDYLRKTGQADEDGVLLTTNVKAGGRFHSNWLNMMYPRLRLAAKLLREDGAIVIHIDEHEYSSLQFVLNEIFGEENQLGTIIWDKRNPKGDATGVAYQHESILIYAKNREVFAAKHELIRPKKNAEAILRKASELFSRLDKSDLPWDLRNCSQKYGIPKDIISKHQNKISLEQINKEFSDWLRSQPFSGGELAYSSIDENADVYQSVSMAWPNKKKAPEDYFEPLIHPITKKACPVPDRGWRNPPGTMQDLLSKRQILFGDDENVQPRRKYFLKDNMFENVPSLLYFGGSDDNLFKSLELVYDNPKPVAFSKQLIQWFTKDDDLILDFFAGSGTAAHAVLEANCEDGWKRRFVCVQLQEIIDETHEAYKLGFRYISEIGKERIRRVIAKMKKTGNSQERETPEDLGFKVFKLTRSNFKTWHNYDGENIAELEKLFDSAETPLIDDWKEEDLLTEIILQQGFPLDSKMTQQTEFNHNKVTLVESNFCGHRLFICLDDKIKDDTVKRLQLRSEDILVCLDSALTDQAKMRLSDICKLNII